jgi:hypothetical protein
MPQSVTHVPGHLLPMSPVRTVLRARVRMGVFRIFQVKYDYTDPSGAQECFPDP